VRTPNLNWLVSRGTVFEKHYCAKTLAVSRAATVYCQTNWVPPFSKTLSQRGRRPMSAPSGNLATRRPASARSTFTAKTRCRAGTWRNFGNIPTDGLYQAFIAE